MRRVLGIDIGGTNIRMGLVDEAFKLTNFERRNCQELLHEDTVPNLIRAIQEYINRIDTSDIAAVSVGIPGQVGQDKSYVYSVPQLHGLQGVDLGKVLSNELGVPAYIAHDVDFLLTHDIRTMNLDPEQNRTIVAFYLGTGLGNALYINGRLHSGKHGVCGELGHIPLYGSHDICGCGASGCAETRCSGRHLAELTAQKFPDCPIHEVFVRHGDDLDIIDFVKVCAIPFATEITILDPDYILLGGGVISMKNFPTKLLEEEIRRRTRRPLPANDLQFVYASDAQSNGVIGGGMVVFDWLKSHR